jgi:release factor glutamine methyltransferase
MKNSKALFHDFVGRITLPESKDEVRSLAYVIFAHVFAVSRTDLLADKAIPVSEDQARKLDEIVQRVNAHEPVQYILGEAEFYSRTFTVNPSVLIPRPETEELVREVLEFMDRKQSSSAVTAMDVGAGSGCIPITLKLERTNASILATDVSHEALAVAQQNAARLKADVRFLRHDILREEIPANSLDIVVSNPPYIAAREKEQMQPNVVKFEPHLALFVTDDDPLIFYKALAEKAAKALRPSGMLCVEINERFGKEVRDLFKKNGFQKVSIVKDLNGKERIVKGVKS